MHRPSFPRGCRLLITPSPSHPAACTLIQRSCNQRFLTISPLRRYWTGPHNSVRMAPKQATLGYVKPSQTTIGCVSGSKSSIGLAANCFFGIFTGNFLVPRARVLSSKPSSLLLRSRRSRKSLKQRMAQAALRLPKLKKVRDCTRLLLCRSE